MADASAGKGWLGGAFPALDAVEFRIEGVERGDARGRGRLALVGQVIGGAREAVDRDDRRPQARRHEQRRDGKIFVMADGHANWANRFQKGTLARRAVYARGGCIRDSGGRFALYLPVRRKRLSDV